MENQNVLLAKEKLLHFIERVRHSKESDFVEADFFQVDIYEEYKALHAEASTLTPTQINSNFSSIEQTAIQFLNLGIQDKKEFEAFVDKFVPSNYQNEPYPEIYDISEHSSKWEGARAIAEFIKTRQGFELVHGGKKFEDFNDEELALIFGSLFGVNIAADCVKSLRTEQVSRVIGYALSGLYRDDLYKYSQLNAKEQEKISVGEFLQNRIQAQDVEGSFEFEDLKNNNAIVSFSIEESKGAKPDQIRAGGKVDHLVVNHKTKTLTYGMTTSAENVKNQEYTFFKGLSALEKLTQQEYVNNKPNLYFGYSVQPYYFMAGIILASDEDQLDLFQAKEQGGKFLSQLGSLQSGEKEVLAQLQYYRLFGNAPSTQVANSVAQFNMFIGGVDTQDTYNWHQEVVEQFKEDPKALNVALFEHTIAYFTSLTNIISRSQMDMSLEGKTKLKVYLNGIVDMSRNMFLAFNHEATTQEYTQTIKPYYEALEHLYEVGRENKSLENANFLSELKTTMRNYSSVERFNEAMEDKAEINITVETQWKDPKPRINKNSPIDYSDLRSTNLHSICLSLEETTHEETNQFLPKYARMIRQLMEGRETLAGIKTIAYGFDKHGVHTPSLNKFIAHLQSLKNSPHAAEYEKIVEFIQKTNFLVAPTNAKGETLLRHYEENAVDLQDYLTDFVMPQLPQSTAQAPQKNHISTKQKKKK